MTSSAPARGAVRAMLEARSVAVVGASPRPGSFGERMVEQARRSASRPAVHLVNPRHREIDGLRVLPSLAEVPGPVDLVLLGVPDAALEEQVALAADRGDRSAVVFGAAQEDPRPGPALAERVATRAREAGMALCGAGCMGFVNVTAGVRALGYVEPDPLPAGPVALVTHSGSAFSALLRTRRRIGWTLAVSSGQELVTTTADYLEHALDDPGTRVVVLLLETLRDPLRVRAGLDRARAQDVPVVLLAVGGSTAGSALVAAHSGAVAGVDAGWEALTDAHGLLRVEDLDEMADLLELLCAGRRTAPAQPGSGIGTVHDSGAERTLVADTAQRLGVPFAELGAPTLRRLGELLDPGLLPGNPLDVWGRGSATRELFADCLRTLADDPAVSAVALSVDLVPELDGDDSYPLAVLDAAASTRKPVAVLSNLAAAIDQDWAARLRERGVPVLEGTRSGLRALDHLRRVGARPPAAPMAAGTLDTARQQRWRDRLTGSPLSAAESFALLADYGIPVPAVEEAGDLASALAAADRVGWPVALKTSGAAHKSDVGGVHLGLGGADEVATAYAELAERLGPRVLVSSMAAPGVELVVGVVHDPMLGPLVVVGAGGVLVELLADRALVLPPVDAAAAGRALDRLACRPLLDGHRGAARVDRAGLVRTVVAVGAIAEELGEDLDALDVNPVLASPAGAVAVDVLVVPRSAALVSDGGRSVGTAPTDGRRGREGEAL